MARYRRRGAEEPLALAVIGGLFRAGGLAFGRIAIKAASPVETCPRAAGSVVA